MTLPLTVALNAMIYQCVCEVLPNLRKRNSIPNYVKLTEKCSTVRLCVFIIRNSWGRGGGGTGVLECV